MKATEFTEHQLERIEQALYAQSFRSHEIVMNPYEEADERLRHENITNEIREILDMVSEYLNDLDAQRQIGDDLTDEGLAKFLS